MRSLSIAEEFVKRLFGEGFQNIWQALQESLKLAYATAEMIGELLNCNLKIFNYLSIHYIINYYF